MSIVKLVVAGTVAVAGIAGVTTFLVKRAEKKRLDKDAQRKADLEKFHVERAAKAKEHAEQMANNPEYADIHRKAQVAQAERETREAAERAEAELIRQRHYNSPEAVAQRERERLIKMEEELIRTRSRERERDLDRMERMYRAANTCNHDCTCGC